MNTFFSKQPLPVNKVTVIGTLLFTLCLIGCSEQFHTNGNAEGFGGGSPLTGVLEVGRANVVDAMNHVQEGYATSALCQFHGCSKGMDPTVCQVVKNMNQNPQQAQDCQTFIVNMASQYIALNTGSTPVQFVLTTDTLSVPAPGGSQMIVDAETNYGPTGFITFNQLDVQSSSSMEIELLLTHEIGHKVDYNGQGQYLDDNSPYASFNTAGGSRAFLDAVGAAIAYYEFDVQSPSVNPRAMAHSFWTGNTLNPATENRMLLWGGSVSKSLSTTGVMYDPAYEAWSPISSVGTPTERVRYAGFWTGNGTTDPTMANLLIVWGGMDASIPINTGAIYNPATDTWSAISTTNAPIARAESLGVNNNAQSSNLGVWTGTEMIVWGGWGVSSANKQITLGDGAAYNPSTNTWKTISSTNAPSARAGSSVVWTGSEMIVWGGTSDGTTVLSDGAAYNPASDTWTPLSTTGAPTARKNATTVWTGTEMLIWGDDVNDETAADNGFLYNPLKGTWSPMSIVGAPLHHNETSVVWTGTEMIIFGGENGGNDFSDGGIYNVASNSWTAVATPEFNNVALGVRRANAAVWTGSSAIFWGGANPAGQLNDGGIFDPLTGTWIATH